MYLVYINLEFNRCFHQFGSPILSANFSQFASWIRNHNKYSLKKFKIGEFVKGLCSVICTLWESVIHQWN